MKRVVLELLQKKKEGHTKIKHIKYHMLSMQNYLKSHMFNNHEASMLLSLRSRTTRESGANFPYNINQMCPMGCITEDTPEHIQVCEHLNSEETKNSDIQYEHIFSDNVEEQAAVTKVFVTLLERREDASILKTGPSHSSVQG